MLAGLQGQIERITYINEENGFTIARVKVYGQRDLVTIVGNLMAPSPGEILEMRGEWTNHRMKLVILHNHEMSILGVVGAVIRSPRFPPRPPWQGHWTFHQRTAQRPALLWFLRSGFRFSGHL
jgi:hypothetical protein